VSNLSGQFTDNIKLTYFETIARHLEVIDEFHVNSRSIVADPVFLRLGLTDVAVGHLASLHSFVVVTADLDLFQHLGSIGVDAYNFNHLRSARFIPTP
jgi:hypothetical protein